MYARSWPWILGIAVLSAAVGAVLQTGIILLDTATMWVLLRSLGAHPPVTGVCASFLIASLALTLSARTA